MYISIEPFHFGAEVVTEIAPPSKINELLKINQQKVFMLMVDDQIEIKEIFQKHIETLKEEVTNYDLHPLIVVHETDLSPIAHQILVRLGIPEKKKESYLGYKPKHGCFLKPSFSYSQIRLFRTLHEFNEKDFFSNVRLDVLDYIKPTCPLYICSWYFFRMYSRIDELDCLTNDPWSASTRQKTRELIIKKAELLRSFESFKDVQPESKIRSVLNRAYESPEEQARIIALHLDNMILKENLSSIRTTKTNFYTLYETLKEVERN